MVERFAEKGIRTKVVVVSPDFADNTKFADEWARIEPGSDAAFCEQVTRLKGNIDSGDSYQVVTARTFTVNCPDAFAAYRQLRE